MAKCLDYRLDIRCILVFRFRFHQKSQINRRFLTPFHFHSFSGLHLIFNVMNFDIIRENQLYNYHTIDLFFLLIAKPPNCKYFLRVYLLVKSFCLSNIRLFWASVVPASENSPVWCLALLNLFVACNCVLENLIFELHLLGCSPVSYYEKCNISSHFACFSFIWSNDLHDSENICPIHW